MIDPKGKLVGLLVNVFLFVIILSCNEKSKIEVDEIVTAKKIYLANTAFETAEAMAIKEGKIIATGTIKEIEDSYRAQERVNYNGFIYPGFIDPHSHFYGYSQNLNQVDLVGTTSLQSIVQKTVEFANQQDGYWVQGRGWDQNDWIEQGSVNNLELSLRLSDRPVLLKRIDGHAALANQKALELAGITAETKVEGGEIDLRNGMPSGLLIDNAVTLVENVISKPSRASQIAGLIQAQSNCLKVGLTCVSDAGLDKDLILLMDSLQSTGDLKIRIYAMCNPSDENFSYFLEKGPIEKDRLQVSSFKLYADGALGSRGALLKAPYCDREDHYGLWVTSPSQLEEWISRLAKSPFQVNTHCIGDSANKRVLEWYGKYLAGDTTRRWRIEHAQVVSPEDRALFAKYHVIPSVQPTHATSDMYWADKRLCVDRLSSAYAYQSLLKSSPYIALGTDFPVESIDPLNTLFAAIYRMDAQFSPPGGYMNEESLSPSDAILGMTLWAAKANFMENRIGSLEAQKAADYVVLDKDVTIEKYMQQIKVIATVIAGERLY